MKLVRWFASISLLLSFNPLYAMDGALDRTAEAAAYINQINLTQAQGAMIGIAKSIYASGLGDEQLSRVIGERLIKDMPKVIVKRESMQYGAWMVKALSSTGTEYARNLLPEIIKKTTVMRVREECRDQLGDIEWHHRKNEIMASRENYTEGENVRVAQMMNLLKERDFSYKLFAAERMNWEKNLDPKLTNEIAKQLQTFVDTRSISRDATEIKAMASYAALLGHSGNRDYLPLLNAVSKSKADYEVISAANSARNKLH